MIFKLIKAKNYNIPLLYTTFHFFMRHPILDIIPFEHKQFFLLLALASLKKFASQHITFQDVVLFGI